MTLMPYAALLLSMLPIQVQAYEIETGTAVVCDTQQQAERLAAVLDGNEEAALNIVNAEEHDPTACARTTIAYVRGATVATARNKADAYEIAEILVLGVVTGRGFRNTVPTRYVSLFKIEERRA